MTASTEAGEASGRHQFLSSCLLNDAVALDAGCLGFAHAPERQARVRHVLLSHTHLDHLAQRLVAQNQVIAAARRWEVVLETADFLVGATDADLEDPDLDTGA